ncbi:response regulator [Bengtsoniella intestinalis]|uniref:response regulator n=1 Tax=Bengtsoniella intestinalis TaxID=3073143 RepID=UPI00391F25A5
MTQYRGIRLIYVDDEPSAITNCKYTVNAYGKVKSAEFFLNAFDALEFVRNNPIDIALLDIDMPQMNGYELAEKLRELSPTLPIAFMTGNVRYLNPKNREMDVPYLFKPYLAEEVFEVLDKVALCG